jgi:hypothetical protein
MIFIIAERTDAPFPFFAVLERTPARIKITGDSINMGLSGHGLDIVQIITKEMRDKNQLPFVYLYTLRDNGPYYLDVLFSVRTDNRDLMSYLLGYQIDIYLASMGMDFPPNGFSLIYSDGARELMPGYVDPFLENYRRERKFTLRIRNNDKPFSLNMVELVLTELTPADPNYAFRQT